MKRSVLALTVLALVTTAQADPPVYQAKSGDTLWDLSARFWKNSWAWPELWALNPHFHNPHWIAPGDPVYLGPRGATGSVRLPLDLVEPEEGGAATATRIGPPEETVPEGAGGASRKARAVTFAKGRAQDFVSPHRIPPLGIVKNLRVPKQIFGAGEDVDLLLGTGSPVKPGDLLTVYDDSSRVFHPRNGSLQGYHVRVLGQLRIRSVMDGRAEGELVETYDAVTDGCSLMAFRPPVVAIVPRSGTARVEGLVLAGTGEKSLFTEQDVVFLDRGALHGLQPGLVLDIPLPPVGQAEGASHLDTPAARLLVLSVEAKTSSVLVLESRTSVSAGDRFVASARP